MYKIDFFPGTHGHFLELIINTFIAQRPFDFNRPLFDDIGACHLHLAFGDPRYQPVVFCKHYSLYGIEFDPADQVIEIHVNPDNLLIALTNYLIRASDQPMDLYKLNERTVEKLSTTDKGQSFLKELVHQFGNSPEYSKSNLRNHFYTIFKNSNYASTTFNQFNHVKQKLIFPFESLFSLDKLYSSLDRCASFLNFTFLPDQRLDSVWQDFLSCNQGYQSQLLCDQVIHAVSTNHSMDLQKLSIIEEAWIAYKLDQPALLEQFPTNTKTINPVVSRVN